MNLTFINQAVASPGTKQPLVGTITAAVIVANPAAQSVLVTSTASLADNDFVWVDTFTNAEQVQIKVVNDTHISAIFTKNHGSGVPIALCEKISSVTVLYPNGGTGALTIFYNGLQFNAHTTYGRGAQVMNLTGPILAIWVLNPTISPNPPTFFSSSNVYGANVDNLCFYWIDGADADGY